MVDDSGGDENEEALKAALTKAIEVVSPESKSPGVRILKSQMPLICKRISDGVSIKQIYKACRAAGLNMAEPTFRTWVRKFRQEMGNE